MLGFNRTIVGWKLALYLSQSLKVPRFNRTIVGWKLNSGLKILNKQAGVLIEPLWDGNSISTILRVLNFFVLIEPLWDGNF
ncbi:hypothetical protein ciss_02000 [Carboxydothermus islandicus]|uniref:Uncharacterized protein n=1 Tax=Carboxydothermus islandicus TaxID=661089 RepID=A0A1L8CZE6_9THEO|nr:hypothetical protein ciss_02000 [Carboxydothermus islandicus]